MLLTLQTGPKPLLRGALLIQLVGVQITEARSCGCATIVELTVMISDTARTSGSSGRVSSAVAMPAIVAGSSARTEDGETRTICAGSTPARPCARTKFKTCRISLGVQGEKTSCVLGKKGMTVKGSEAISGVTSDWKEEGKEKMIRRPI